ADENSKKAAYTIDDKKITIGDKEGKFVIGYKLDGTKIDMEILEAPFEGLKGSKGYGIVEMKGDTLKLAYATEKDKRPKDFKGKDLTGWKTLGTKDKPGDSLEGKTEAFNGRFKVKNGELVIDPSVKGDVRIETVKEYVKDVTIKFEFFPDAKCNNDLFFRGEKFDLSKDNVKNIKTGEWNPIEITVKDGKTEF